jgi:DNA-binding transcriptional MerR regulator
MSSEQEHGEAVSAKDPARLTIEQLGRRVGMSARNIRAHQARKLLSPPVRDGRTAYYDQSHVRRLEAIHDLQRQGYNLVAITTILGVRERVPSSDELTALLDRLLAQQPVLIHTLSRHGVLARGDDGRVRTVRPRALRAALALGHAGIQPGSSLQILSEALDQVMLVAEELIRAVSVLALTAAPRPGHAPGEPPDDFGQVSVALAERLVVLLTEAFRVAMENSGQAWIPEQVTPSSGGLKPRSATTVDFG